MKYDDIFKVAGSFLAESKKKENFTVQPNYWNTTILANLISQCISIDRRHHVITATLSKN